MKQTINYKKIVIILMIIYIVLSPILILVVANESYHKGMWVGIATGTSWNEEQHSKQSPLNNYNIGEHIMHTDEYSKFFNGYFDGYIESFDKNGNVTIFIEHGINVARPKLIINEYWTQRCITSECNWENRWKA